MTFTKKPRILPKLNDIRFFTNLRACEDGTGPMPNVGGRREADWIIHRRSKKLEHFVEAFWAWKWKLPPAMHCALCRHCGDYRPKVAGQAVILNTPYPFCFRYRLIFPFAITCQEIEIGRRRRSVRFALCKAFEYSKLARITVVRQLEREILNEKARRMQSKWDEKYNPNPVLEGGYIHTWTESGSVYHIQPGMIAQLSQSDCQEPFESYELGQPLYDTGYGRLTSYPTFDHQPLRAMARVVAKGSPGDKVIAVQAINNFQIINGHFVSSLQGSWYVEDSLQLDDYRLDVAKATEAYATNDYPKGVFLSSTMPVNMKVTIDSPDPDIKVGDMVVPGADGKVQKVSGVTKMNASPFGFMFNKIGTFLSEDDKVNHLTYEEEDDE